MNDIWKSKELWTGIVGAVATLLVFFVGKYAASSLEDVQIVLNTLLPIVLFLIGGYTAQSIVKMNNENSVRIEEMRLASLQLQVRLAAMDAGVEKHSSKDAAKHG